jgi:outer membrane receptor protein involved in Fe transport
MSVHVSLNRSRKSCLLCSSATLLAIALSGAAAGSAHAQASSSGPAAPASAAAPASVNEVVVTGSRIARKDYSSESPIVTVQSQTLLSTSAISIDQQLDKLPQFVPGANQITSAGDVQATPTDSPGISTVNLRGLGENRTLVLLDGRRTQPNNASLVVDINTIPEEALDGVEIITGGAASTYGADAVAGVVNFKLKHDYQGITMDAQYGETFAGDGAETRITTLVGANFADNRGNAMIGLTYENRDPVLLQNRSFFSNAFTDPNSTYSVDPFVNAPGFNVAGYQGYEPFLFIPNNAPQSVADADFANYIPGYKPGDINLAYDAIYFNKAATTGAATLYSVNPGNVSRIPAIGYTGPLAPNYKLNSAGQLDSNDTNGYLSLPLTRYSLFANAHYDISPHVTAYVQANFDENETKTALSGQVPAVNQWGVQIPYDPTTDSPVLPGTTSTPNPNFIAFGAPGAQHPVPTELAILLNARPTPDATWQLNDELDYLGPRSLDTTTDTYEILGGIKGDLPINDWTFDLYGSHGRTDILVQYYGFADQARYQSLIAMPDYGAGANFNDGLTGLLASCTSGLNPFITASVSQDCKNIVGAQIKTSSVLQQDQVELDIQGALFKAPAGDVRFAVGADYRGDSYAYFPDPEMATTNITSATLGIFDAAPTSGDEDVFEGYGELLAPVLRDMPFVKSFQIDAGYRFSSYNNAAGGVSTWKVNADWDVNDWIKFRGGYEVANRAPNIAELYQPQTTVVNGWIDSDPCANTTHATYGNVASNPNRNQVLALCTALSGGFPITTSFLGQVPAYFPLSLDTTFGNPNLKSENATTWTVGTVLKSPVQASLLRRLQVSVDYYNIDIQNAIASLDSQIIYQECFNGFGSNPTYSASNPYCKLIVRSAANGDTDTVEAAFTNLGSISTAGIDAQLDWSTEVPSFTSAPATLFANVQFNWLQYYDVVIAPGAQPINYAGTIGSGITSPPYGAQFKWKLYTTIGYNVGPATVTASWRHLPGANYYQGSAEPTGSYDEFDLSGRWAVTSRYEIRGGIENLFNTQPNIVGAIPGVNDGVGYTDPAGSYDLLGRRFYVGIKARF